MAKPPITPVPSPNFTAGRCGPGQPLAIVLHEYDGAIEQLDSQMIQPVLPPFIGCHTSLHYGLSGCVIHQYVQDADTAYSFFGAGSCGTGTWTFPAAFPGIDPNCYTLNIAVTTGVLGLDGICEPNPNNYTPETLRCLANLICALSQKYNIAPDSIHVIRHQNELADLPFTELMDAVIVCINAPPPPAGDVQLCTAISTLPQASPGPNTLLVGSDCRLYPYPASSDLCSQLAALPTGTPAVPGSTRLVGTDCQAHVIPAETVFAGVDTPSITWTPGGTNGHSPQANARLSATAGNQLTTNPDGLFVAPAAAIPGINPIDTSSVDLTVSGADGHTLAADVRISNDPSNQLSQQVAGLYVPPFDLCAGLAALVSGGQAVPGLGGTALVGANCQTFTLPAPAPAFDLCASLAALAAGTAVGLGTALVGPDCQTHAMPNLPADCDSAPFSALSLLAVGGGIGVGFSRNKLPYRTVNISGTATPATDGVVGINAGANPVTLTLLAPTNCEANYLIVKRLDISANVVTVASAALIDGCATILLGSPGAFCPTGGEAVHLLWTGSTWIIL